MTSDAAKPTFRSFGAPLEVDDQALAAINERLGVPELQRAGAVTARAPVAMRAALEKLTLEVPDYLGAALRMASAERRISVRHLVILALKDAGYAINDVDMIPDGRRSRK